MTSKHQRSKRIRGMALGIQILGTKKEADAAEDLLREAARLLYKAIRQRVTTNVTMSVYTP